MRNLGNTKYFFKQNAVFRKMATVSLDITPPAAVRGLTELDKCKFVREFRLPIIQLEDHYLSKAMKNIKPYLLKIDNFKPVQILGSVDPQNVVKCAFLDPTKASKWIDLKENDRSALQDLGVSEDKFDYTTLQLNYDNWKSDQIFNAVLPTNEENLSSFSKIGHIVHLNLRDHLLEYKKLIGQVLLDKVSNCKTVVNKTKIIDNTYRNFTMEVLAGEENFLVAVKENKCIFEFDFSKVYWNSRLGKEHERIISLLNYGDILFDVFAGVGPFAVPSLKKKCIVYANDLNPESYKWLNHNAELNKVDKNLFQSFNVDGRQFIADVFYKYMRELYLGEKTINQEQNKIHVTMNLPAMAVEFLDALVGGLKDVTCRANIKLQPIIHVYCFAIGDTPEVTAKEMIEKHLGFDLNENFIECFFVRNVSPKKNMMRVSFQLVQSIMASPTPMKRSLQIEEEKDAKKICVHYVSDITKDTFKMEFHSHDYSEVLKETINTIKTCFDKYQVNEVFLSFNGGKDCTVLLDIIVKVIQDIFNDPEKSCELKVIYMRCNHPFPELEEFIEHIKKEYEINLSVYSGNIKDVLAKILIENPNLKACLMGTRRSDPYSESLKEFQKTDVGWPQIMRVSPILEWSYEQVWSYLLENQVPYCSLYDVGYTSIGSVNNTLPNPTLQFKHVDGTVKYKPAYLLTDGTQERKGRINNKM